MDQLIELNEWQQMQEEVIRRRQSQPLNVLTNTESRSDGNERNVGTVESETMAVTDEGLNRQTIATVDHKLEEEIASEDNCHQMNGNNSFGKNVSFLESSPVVGGINGRSVKTFEELLDLRLNSDKNIYLNKSDENKPKKPFLRKGAGIKRFNANKCQTIVSSIPTEKKDFKRIKTNETKPKLLFKPSIIKRNLKKIDEKPVKPKTIKRTVIPLTTKSDHKNKSVLVTRITPTVIKDMTESESDLFGYLQEVCGNGSNDNSFDDKFKDKDINELQDLLQKIELKRTGMERHFDGKEGTIDPNNCRKQSKQLNNKTNKIESKRVHWSPDTQSIAFEERDDQMCDFEKPKTGAYSSSLRQQICELEDRLVQMEAKKRDQIGDNSVKSDENMNPINGILTKFGQQIERLNKRVMNIESKSYDLISTQTKEISNRKQNIKCYVERNAKTLPKTILSPTNGLNICVNEGPNDTTIDFPNGDKMTVSEDNTIFYTFANGATQTTYPDGLKIIQFPNGQMERWDKTGVKHITYANGLQRVIKPDSSEEIRMTDGTVWRILSDGSEVLEFTNGDREIRTDKYKRREYSNGNIKTLFSDGTEETRYVCGRLRVKDRFGNLMIDSMARQLNEHLFGI